MSNTYTELYGLFCVPTEEGLIRPVGFSMSPEKLKKFGVAAQSWSLIDKGELLWKSGESTFPYYEIRSVPFVI